MKTFAVTQQELIDPQGAVLAGRNDLFVGEDGNLVLAGLTQDNDSQIQATLYAVQNLVQTQLGEEVLQINRGMPNFETIWQGGVVNLSQWEIALRQLILSVSGVIEITGVTITKENDILSYVANITTSYGPGFVNGQVLPQG